MALRGDSSHFPDFAMLFIFSWQTLFHPPPLGALEAAPWRWNRLEHLCIVHCCPSFDELLWDCPLCSLQISVCIGSASARVEALFQPHAEDDTSPIIGIPPRILLPSPFHFSAPLPFAIFGKPPSPRENHHAAPTLIRAVSKIEQISFFVRYILYR